MVEEPASPLATSPRVALIRSRLSEALAPQDLDIEDVSHEHAGHEGAKSGGGHFNVLIVSEVFAGKTLLKRHRLVYEALGDAMQTDIHALSIRAYTPDEF
ncbi:MAG: BolA/IbaG family iron-sulfur metabolism protein [Gammaproteobacteria bacterium]|nr:BolA/IbaG family iron-sulfur metabolism protein [Gammaproteobacteria bacterium]